ncbi:hypothetical protein EX30DRAFT_10070 [Ascodesmis nigricans]|uniref:Uncharacterized protein n=1 Tax=Ascodesmis nigricans TaxID=341454 RepID=A0A4S2N6U5_9PEZI|nr:hypothetical protein EX30DRAFT_10070 [Ascodesmis nigricans]
MIVRVRGSYRPSTTSTLRKSTMRSVERCPNVMRTHEVLKRYFWNFSQPAQKLPTIPVSTSRAKNAQEERTANKTNERVHRPRLAIDRSPRTVHSSHIPKIGTGGSFSTTTMATATAMMIAYDSRPPRRYGDNALRSVADTTMVSSAGRPEW